MSAGLYEITVNALLDRGVALSRAEWETAAARVGHERAPALLVELTEADLLPAEVLPRAVADAWTGPRRPTHRLDPEQWVELFGAAGYAVDGEPAPRPGAPVRLYRGDVDEHRAGMTWTEDRERATAGCATAWTTLAAPEALLARFTAADGGEYVVDPTVLGGIAVA
ncbi:MAG: hypothetical protein L0I76_27400 [Pseudonocardia sp.]|nr:hypothetical protein [Pseudonocardia sp.]